MSVNIFVDVFEEEPTYVANTKTFSTPNTTWLSHWNQAVLRRRRELCKSAEVHAAFLWTSAGSHTCSESLIRTIHERVVDVDWWKRGTP